MPGVPGGVAPLPLALLAPITFTSSFTETPCSSGGRSLLNAIGLRCSSAGEDLRLPPWEHLDNVHNDKTKLILPGVDWR